MRRQRRGTPVRLGAALAIVLALGACTKGGQFDPTEVFNSDVFDSKKKLSGQRQAVFPDGVPGTTTGVPADLVKGYQPPPDPNDPDAMQAATGPGGPPASGPPAGAAAAPAATAAAKPKPKPKPKLASKPSPQGQDPVWNQTGPAAGGPTHISVGAKTKATSAPPAQGGGADQGGAQANWPAPNGAPPAQRTAQPSWPNPSSTTQ
jgi:hypothetical protein